MMRAPDDKVDTPAGEPAGRGEGQPRLKELTIVSAAGKKTRIAADADPEAPDHDESAWMRWRRRCFGAPRDLLDRAIFHRLALIPVLAWVGLGADALSSSSYGPEECFKFLSGSAGPALAALAVALAAATAVTVMLLGNAYSALIEAFPGGGAYVVATRMLGSRTGLFAGSALVVDYVFTITVSVVASGAAAFSLLPPAWGAWELPFDFGVLLLLAALNLRGVRESIVVLTPIFAAFIVAHILLIGGGLVQHLPDAGRVALAAADGFGASLDALGPLLLLNVFLCAYALGGGTYTGLESISNAVPLMREPKVANARRTMVYMAISLSVCAGGLIVCYLLWDIRPVEGKTMNAVLAGRVFAGWPGGTALVWTTMLSAAALLLVAAQAGFIAGPRVIANMAVDSWLPRGFSSLSERLTTSNGIILMAVAAGAALLVTRGDISTLVVIYAITVFLSFTLSMAGMIRYWWRQAEDPARPGLRRRRLWLFIATFTLCATILAMTFVERFGDGGWASFAVTGGLTLLCLLIRSHYDKVRRQMSAAFTTLERTFASPVPRALERPDATKHTAAILVSHYNGVGIHTVLHALAAFPRVFQGVVFIGIGLVDSDRFKGDGAMADLDRQTRADLEKYVALANQLELPAEHRMAVGTDLVHEAVEVALQVSGEYRHVTFFAGKVIFKEERWYHRLLHNDAAFAFERRLQWAGKTVLVVPARIS